MPNLVEKICEVLRNNPDKLHEEFGKIIKDYNDKVDEIGPINTPISDIINPANNDSTNYPLLHHLIARGHYMQAIRLIGMGADAHYISSFDGNQGLTIDIGDFAFYLVNSKIISELAATEIMALMLANMYLFKNDSHHRSIDEICKIIAKQRPKRLHPDVAEEVESRIDRISKQYSKLSRLAAAICRNFYVIEGKPDALDWENLCTEMETLAQTLYSNRYIFEPEVIEYWRARSTCVPVNFGLRF